MAIAVVLTVGVGWRQAHQRDPAPTFCTADGYVLADGSQLHRDADRGCSWVDQDGNPVTPPTR